MDTALAIFAERGFAGVSLRAVAAQAGITHAGLLHYFDGKDDLLLTIMIERDRAEIAAMRAYATSLAPAGTRRPPIASILIPWAIRDIARNQTRPDIAPLFVKLSAEATDETHPAHDYFRRRYSSLRTSLTSAFTQEFARASGSTSRDPATCARQFLALADGLQLQWLLEPDSTDMVAELLDYLRSVGIEPTGWRGIEVPEDPPNSRPRSRPRPIGE